MESDDNVIKKKVNPDFDPTKYLDYNGNKFQMRVKF
jgi:hypothetical protein